MLRQCVRENMNACYEVEGSAASSFFTACSAWGLSKAPASVAFCSVAPGASFLAIAVVLETAGEPGTGVKGSTLGLEV